MSYRRNSTMYSSTCNPSALVKVAFTSEGEWLYEIASTGGMCISVVFPLEGVRQSNTWKLVSWCSRSRYI